MNEKVTSGAFLPHLNIAMSERMYDNVFIMSTELNIMIMTLEHIMNNQPLISNLQNIIVYSDS
jgi:hypothetical protein